MHPTLHHLLAQDRREELRRQARPAPGDRTDRALGPPATKRTRLSLRGGTS